jgi:hypothetical protein
MSPQGSASPVLVRSGSTENDAMTVAVKQGAPQTSEQPPVKARELMEKLNAEAS